MKKSYLSVFTVLALVMLLSVSAFAAASGTEQYIGEAKAKSIALESAGLSEAEATFLKVHLDHDDRRVVYDVEFYSGDTEYDYEINAVSGDVFESDKEIEYYSIPWDTAATANDTGSYIGEAKAKAIALASAGLSESQVSRMKVKLDRGDGKTIYEVDFRNGQMEYEYEIDAVSGAILESDAEFDD
jgi:uncharacterized membrane protein YkoI